MAKKNNARPNIQTVMRHLEEIYELLEQKRNGGLGYLVVRSGEKAILVPTSAIDWIEAKRNYVWIHRGKESTRVRKTMKELQAELNSRRFLRVHRSAIVNVDRIQEVHHMFHGEIRLILRDGTELILSRHYRRNFQEFVG